jgi:hypothetical protein
MSELRDVSKEAFWAWVMTTQRNVHPTPRGRTTDAEGAWSEWRDQGTGQLIGKSFPKTGRYYLHDGIRVPNV